MDYPTPETLRDAVNDAGGVLTVRVEQVRDAFGYGRLGVHVRSEISRKLAGFGIAHYPVSVPDYQDRPLRLYRMGTPMAELIDAVLNPNPTHDEEIKQAVSGTANEVLAQVRDLVCR